MLLSLTILGLTEAGGFIIPVFRFMSAHKHQGAAGSIDRSFLPWLRSKGEKAQVISPVKEAVTRQRKIMKQSAEENR